MKLILNKDVNILNENSIFKVRFKQTDREYIINESIYHILYSFKDKSYSISSFIRHYNSLLELELDDNLQKQFKTIIKTFVDLNVLIESKKELDKHYNQIVNINQKVGIYKIVEIISINKKTTVCLAFNTVTNEKIVCKFFYQKKDDLNFQNKEFTKFKNEYSLQNKVKSNFVCNIYDYLEIENYLFFTMEYIEGLTLNKYVKTVNLTEKEKLKISFDIIKAFVDVHKAKIIYGDINLNNIMVKKNNHVKLIDFGFAYRDKTKAKIHGGVAFFIPPERLNSSNHKFSLNLADYQSDIYQIGLLIFYIYFKKIPFKGYIWKDLRNSIASFDINNELVKNEINDGVEKILKKCLQKDKEKRYLNAIELFNDFKKNVIL